ncbi:hypothetical protein AVEN_101539-1 [Araneus ventricosus]|uniref:Endonuclease/exonuclease/phosphatase domain-containing protein n=1 Tax=Araneus ventricosus TaxID=182803 RepID=A0A4Y2VXR9_ARAVE|nr:hypothetical protein AVEN_101539-1 [Araneus ventricosus]
MNLFLAAFRKTRSTDKGEEQQLHKFSNTKDENSLIIHGTALFRTSRRLHHYHLDRMKLQMRDFKRLAPKTILKSKHAFDVQQLRCLSPQSELSLWITCVLYSWTAQSRVNPWGYMVTKRDDVDSEVVLPNSAHQITVSSIYRPPHGIISLMNSIEFLICLAKCIAVGDFNAAEHSAWSLGRRNQMETSSMTTSVTHLILLALQSPPTSSSPPAQWQQPSTLDFGVPNFPGVMHSLNEPAAIITGIL